MNNWVKVWGAGTQSLANGQLVMKSDARFLNKTPVPNDFRVTVDKATLTSGNGYGLMFRMSQSGSNYSGYAFQADPGYGNKFIFRRYDQNGVELGAPLAVGAPPLTLTGLRLIKSKLWSPALLSKGTWMGYW